MLIQFIIIAFAVFAMSRVVFRYRKEGLALLELVWWLVFWGAVIVAALLPDVTNIIAQFVGVGRGADLVTYISIIVLFYIVFKLLGRVYKIERDITNIVRKSAIDEPFNVPKKK